MTNIPAPGADLATDECALFEKWWATQVEMPTLGEFLAWKGWQARADLAAVPASEPTQRPLPVGVADSELSTMLWLYRRLPRCYARPPFVEHTIKVMAKRTGADVAAFLAERDEQTSSAPARGEQAPTGAAPAPVSGMPDPAGLQRYFNSEFGVEKFSRAQHKNMPSIETYFLAADVERLLNPTGATK